MKKTWNNILIKDMSTNHLKNAIRFIEEKMRIERVVDELEYLQINYPEYKYLRQELELRKLTLEV